VNRATGETHFTYREGRLDSLEGHSLIVRPSGVVEERSGADSARASMTRMVLAEAFTGSQRHAMQGAVSALVVGAIVGYLVADPGRSGGNETCVSHDPIFICGMSSPHADARLARTLSFGLGAAAAGAIVGHFVRTESWTPVNVAGLRRWLRME
jgi:hypothetical protein